MPFCSNGDFRVGMGFKDIETGAGCRHYHKIQLSQGCRLLPKGKQKTTPVNDNDILYHLKMFLPFIQIGMFVFAAALFSGDSNDVPQRVESISFDGGKAELVIFDQGAFGSYADLNLQ